MAGHKQSKAEETRAQIRKVFKETEARHKKGVAKRAASRRAASKRADARRKKKQAK